ncbi:MAG TPA: hypothetical protein VKT32_04570 [Chthonomonadaceae bacterium]|nr:hypothetical protein [Chthonomonadaceae bacterium]
MPDLWIFPGAPRRFLFSLMLSLLAVGALAVPPAAKPARYVDTYYHYSFQPPAGWQRKADLPRPYVAYIGPEENGFAANFLVSVYAKPVEANELSRFMKRVQIKNGVMYAMKPTTLGGLPARTWRTHLHVPGHVPVENRQWVCITRNHAFELTFTMLPAARKQFDPVCDQIVKSFRWEK